MGTSASKTRGGDSGGGFRKATLSLRRPAQTVSSEAVSAATVGLGSFWLGQSIVGNGRIVEHKETQRLYVLSSVPKKADTRVFISKRTMLERLDHPFIASLRYSFQDAQHLYIATDLVSGGTLQSHMHGQMLFSENTVKLWAAELASALHYMHVAHGVAHRSLNASAVLLDSRGHAVLGGLDAAAAASGPSAALLFADDWRALGALMYECIYGKQPFAHGETADVAYFPVVAGQRTTQDCMSAIRGLMNRDPRTGLGNGDGGMRRLRMHPFFATFDWDQLEERQHSPLYIPEASGISVAATFAGGNYHPLRVASSNRRVADFLDYDYAEYAGFKQCYFHRDAMPEEVAVAGRILARSYRSTSVTPPVGVPVDPHTWGSMHPHQRQLAIRYSAKLEKAYELYSTAGAGSHEGNDLDSMLQSMYSLASSSLLTTARGDTTAALSSQSSPPPEAAAVSPGVSRNASNASIFTVKTRPQTASSPRTGSKENVFRSNEKQQHPSLSNNCQKKQRYILTAAGPRPLMTSSGTMPRLKPIASAEWNRPQSPARGLPSPLSTTRPTKLRQDRQQQQQQQPSIQALSAASHLRISQQRFQRSDCKTGNSNKSTTDDFDVSDWEIITAW
ncbi:Serine/threonine kinase [Coemansia sp. RSA 1933]|nr:Serine/threonine kinase [Coemansia sp. RSA 1933]